DAVFSDDGTPQTLGTLTVAAMRWAHRVLASDAELVVASERPSTPATLVDVWLDVGAAPLLTLPDAAAVERAQLPEVAQTVASFEEKSRRQVFDGFVSGCGLLDLVFNYGPAARQVLSEGLRLPA
ncbi:MAG: hypothetical protein AAFU38_17860, partial [Bacteroidota bacterium]